MPIVFKTIDSVMLNEPSVMPTVQIKAGDEISITIPKAVYKENCIPKVAIVECCQKVDCLPVQEEDRNILYACLYTVDNDNKAFANVAIKDKNNIGSFVIGYKDDYGDAVELFEYEGGDYEDLISYLDGNQNFGYEVTAYGFKIFVDEKYAGKDIYISEKSNMFLIGDKYCLNRSKYYGLSICVPKTGCYQIILYSTANGVETPLA